MKTNTDATLYNKTIVGGAEVWTRSEIVGLADTYGVHWENRKAANVMRSGLLEADSVTIFIPFIVGSFVFRLGDVMVKGIVEDTIHGLIPAIVGPPAIPSVPAFTMSMLKAKYADVIVIKSVDKEDFGSSILQHWQIGGS